MSERYQSVLSIRRCVTNEPNPIDREKDKWFKDQEKASSKESQKINQSMDREKDVKANAFERPEARPNAKLKPKLWSSCFGIDPFTIESIIWEKLMEDVQE
ncbi:hypothetical protein CROQUDRAFT_95755 [Cronartium quercuum f. sp. fusiforme G11]|uniref:Uncharacterized protein n=1 Tax=Cronartium quercuum f. sp. fusiforme G11 TaxID=708437 RepID=A0A9P6NC12_9BASI|nr:hypothetical protein CROQUDRAFT_95755 [Cronartium quercuum f. sp. fusiforme G11]